MKIALKKSITVLLIMGSLFVGYTNISYGDIKENGNALNVRVYEVDMKEQSVLQKYLVYTLSIETLKILIEKDELCDFCGMRDLLFREYQEGFSSYFKELGFSEQGTESFLRKMFRKFSFSYFSESKKTTSMGSDSESNEPCDLCDLSHTFGFRQLYDKLFSKMIELRLNEYDLLREQNEKIAEEVIKVLEGFDMNSAKELFEQEKKFDNLTKQIKEIGDFPNILNNLMIFKKASHLILFFMVFKQQYEKIEAKQVQSVIYFSSLLATYKKFLEENRETLFEIEEIVNNEYQIGDKKKTEIKSIDEIMIEVHRVQNGRQDIFEEFYKNSAKDLL